MLTWFKKWWNPNYPYKIGYKVVSRKGYINGEPILVSSSPINAPCVQYRVNIATTRPTKNGNTYGPLYIFKRFFWACVFVEAMSDFSLEIWKCKYLPSKEKPKCRIRGKGFAEEVILLEQVK